MMTKVYSSSISSFFWMLLMMMLMSLLLQPSLSLSSSSSSSFSSSFYSYSQQQFLRRQRTKKRFLQQQDQNQTTTTQECSTTTTDEESTFSSLWIIEMVGQPGLWNESIESIVLEQAIKSVYECFFDNNSSSSDDDDSIDSIDNIDENNNNNNTTNTTNTTTRRKKGIRRYLEEEDATNNESSSTSGGFYAFYEIINVTVLSPNDDLFIGGGGPIGLNSTRNFSVPVLIEVGRTNLISILNKGIFFLDNDNNNNNNNTASIQPSTSNEPSYKPTISNMPSQEPTITSNPTISNSPTSNPSDTPSILIPTQSYTPTDIPSSNPSSSSSNPSLQPSFQPSSSFVPSTIPTTSPSSTPSSSPTTAIPSSNPSEGPTTSPTTSPSTPSPTSSPTTSPTSSSPTTSPTTPEPTTPAPVVTPDPTPGPTSGSDLPPAAAPAASGGAGGGNGNGRQLLRTLQDNYIIEEDSSSDDSSDDDDYIDFESCGTCQLPYREEFVETLSTLMTTNTTTITSVTNVIVTQEVDCPSALNGTTNTTTDVDDDDDDVIEFESGMAMYTIGNVDTVDEECLETLAQSIASLYNRLNMLTTCDSEFRQIIDATAVLDVNSIRLGQGGMSPPDLSPPPIEGLSADSEEEAADGEEEEEESNGRRRRHLQQPPSDSPTASFETDPTLQPTSMDSPTDSPTTSSDMDPSSQPTSFPTIRGPDIYTILIRTSGVCRGCPNDATLFNQVSSTGERKLLFEEDEDVDDYLNGGGGFLFNNENHHQQQRGLSISSSSIFLDNDDDKCYCLPDTIDDDDGGGGGLTEEQFLAAWRIESSILGDDDLPCIDRVSGIEEVRVVNCTTGNTTNLTATYMVVNFIGEDIDLVSESDIVRLELAIMEEYEESQAQVCDPFDRSLPEVRFVQKGVVSSEEELEPTSNVRRRQLQGGNSTSAPTIPQSSQPTSEPSGMPSQNSQVTSSPTFSPTSQNSQATSGPTAMPSQNSTATSSPTFSPTSQGPNLFYLIFELSGVCVGCPTNTALFDQITERRLLRQQENHRLSSLVNNDKFVPFLGSPSPSSRRQLNEDDSNITSTTCTCDVTAPDRAVTEDEFVMNWSVRFEELNLETVQSIQGVEFVTELPSGEEPSSSPTQSPTIGAGSGSEGTGASASPSTTPSLFSTEPFPSSFPSISDASSSSGGGECQIVTTGTEINPIDNESESYDLDGLVLNGDTPSFVASINTGRLLSPRSFKKEKEEGRGEGSPSSTTTRDLQGDSIASCPPPSDKILLQESRLLNTDTTGAVAIAMEHCISGPNSFIVVNVRNCGNDTATGDTCEAVGSYFLRVAAASFIAEANTDYVVDFYVVSDALGAEDLSWIASGDPGCGASAECSNSPNGEEVVGSSVSGQSIFDSDGTYSVEIDVNGDTSIVPPTCQDQSAAVFSCEDRIIESGELATVTVEMENCPTIDSLYFVIINVFRVDDGTCVTSSPSFVAGDDSRPSVQFVAEGQVQYTVQFILTGLTGTGPREWTTNCLF